ncbi:MAG: hypothetical protein LBV42_01940 [Methanobrevibacter sp.]|nr:hypothetical protein [Methanobrevibacter sp.]
MLRKMLSVLVIAMLAMCSMGSVIADPDPEPCPWPYPMYSNDISHTYIVNATVGDNITINNSNLVDYGGCRDIVQSAFYDSGLFNWTYTPEADIYTAVSVGNVKVPFTHMKDGFAIKNTFVFNVVAAPKPPEPTNDTV